MELSKIAFVGLVSAMAVACASSHTPSDTSAKGTVALSSFKGGAPTAIVAKDGHGTERSVKLDANGAFAIALPKGDRYALSVEVDGRRVPVVMVRRSGKLDATFKVSSRGGIVDLGSVKFLVAGPKPTFVTSTAATSSSSSSCDPNGTGNYECVDDSEQSQCEGGGGSENGDHGADGECENGVDKSTHAPCTDPAGDDAEQADANAEMAVPDRSAPSDVSGCDDGEQAGD